MNQNQIGRTVFDIDEETDAFYLQKAAEYHEWLIQQEAQPRLTRTPIFRDREDAERRLRADYFDDHLPTVIRSNGHFKGSTPGHLFLIARVDEYLQMSEHTAQDALFFFNMCIIELYMPNYLRKPTSEDVRQESARKDVEHAFGVLQGRWRLIQQPTRAYEVNTLCRIMYAGIIMHNMILEDQNMSVVDLKHVYSNPARSMQTMWIDRCETQRRKAKELRDRDTYSSIQQNLINHIWPEVEEASEED
ncbi:ALP1-like protein [Tanacetum coccineum]